MKSLRDIFEEKDLDSPDTEIVSMSTGNNRVIPLHGVPNENGPKTEKPMHRYMCILSSRGLSNREIAEATGYTPTQVGNVLRAPWAKKLISELIHQEMGETGAVEFLRGAVTDVVVQLKDIALNAEKPADRLSGCKEILDRVFGKSTQPIAAVKKDVTPEDDVAGLKAELAELRKKQANTSIDLELETREGELE